MHRIQTGKVVTDYLIDDNKPILKKNNVSSNIVIQNVCKRFALFIFLIGYNFSMYLSMDFRTLNKICQTNIISLL